MTHFPQTDSEHAILSDLYDLCSVATTVDEARGRNLAAVPTLRSPVPV